MKKMFIVGGFGTIAIIAGASASGWALVSKSPTAEKMLINSQKISPKVNEEMFSYSVQHVIDFSKPTDFTFNSSVEGYNNRINYEIVEKNKSKNKPNTLTLVIKTNVKDKNYINHTYSIDVKGEFVEQQKSDEFVVNQTINNFPTFKKDITLLNHKNNNENEMVTPKDIDLESTNFRKQKDSDFFINKDNGSFVKVVNVLDLKSFANPSEKNNFKVNYEKLTGLEYNLISSIIEQNINNNKTIILFSVNPNEETAISGQFTKGVMLMKDFSSSNSSLMVENAPEFSLIINSSSIPTAQEIIDSFNDERNWNKYLKFDLSGNVNENKLAFQKFNYNIESIEIPQNDLLEQKSLEIEVQISNKRSPITKKYSYKLFSLLSVQQNNININSLKDKLFYVIPTLNSHASLISIDEIINNPQKYIEFLNSKPNYIYEVISASKELYNGGNAIRIEVRIKDKQVPSATLTYFPLISSGWN